MKPKTRFHKLTAWLLALAMLMTFIPSFTLTASAAATTYDLWVGGEQVTSEKLTVAGTTGTATYDPDTNTLTLNNYTYEGTGYTDLYCGAIYYGGADTLKLVLVGENSITHAPDNTTNSSGIYVSSDLMISGNGELTANGGAADYQSSGIYVDGDITLSGGLVTATGGTSNIHNSSGVYSFGGTISVSGGKLAGNGGAAYSISSGLHADDGNIIVLGGELVGTGGASCSFSDGLHAKSITVSGGTAEATGAMVTNESASSRGAYTVMGSITVSGGSLTATGGTSANAGSSYGVWADMSEIIVTDGSLIATGGTADSSEGAHANTITVSGGVTVAQGGTVAFNNVPTVENALAVYDANDNVIENPSWQGSGALTYAKIAEASSDPTAYTVTVSDTIENGTVVADKATAAEGDTVTLTITPATSYELDTLTVKDADNGNVTVTDNKFTMPAKNVTVTATFKSLTPVIESITFNSDSTAYDAATNTFCINAENPLVLTVTGKNMLGQNMRFLVANTNVDAVYDDVTSTGDETFTYTVDEDFYRLIIESFEANNYEAKIAYVGICFADESPSMDDLVALNVTRKSYTVTVTTASNGTVTADKENAAEGETVTLTITPASGYELDTLTVKDADDGNVTVTDNKFTMPAKNVTVTATFKAADTSTGTITGYAPDTKSPHNNTDGNAQVTNTGWMDEQGSYLLFHWGEDVPLYAELWDNGSKLHSETVTAQAMEDNNYLQFSFTGDRTGTPTRVLAAYGFDSDLTAAMPGEFTQSANQDPGILSDHILLQGSGAYGEQVDFTHIPAYIRFKIYNWRTEETTVKSVSLRIKDDSPVASSAVALTPSSEGWTTAFTGEHTEITTTLIDASLAIDEQYFAYAMALPLGDEDAFKDKVIQLVITTDGPSSKEFVAYELEGEIFESVTGSYNWTGGDLYTFHLYLDCGGNCQYEYDESTEQYRCTVCGNPCPHEESNEHICTVCNVRVPCEDTTGDNLCDIDGCGKGIYPNATDLNVKATVENGAVTVTWDALEDVGTDEVASYTVYYYPAAGDYDNRTKVVYETGAEVPFTHTFTGLTAGVTYEVGVTAVYTWQEESETEITAPFEAEDCTEVTFYNLWVGGVQVTNANADDVLGTADDDGETEKQSVTYDPDTNTLTLTDATINNIDGVGIEAKDSGITIVGVDTDADGTNTICGRTSAIKADGEITIKGKIGDMTGGSEGGIYSTNGNINIDKDAVLGNISSGWYTLQTDEGNIVIDGTVGNINGLIAITSEYNHDVIINGKVGDITGVDYGICSYKDYKVAETAEVGNITSIGVGIMAVANIEINGKVGDVSGQYAIRSLTGKVTINSVIGTVKGDCDDETAIVAAIIGNTGIELAENIVIKTPINAEIKGGTNYIVYDTKGTEETEDDTFADIVELAYLYTVTFETGDGSDVEGQSVVDGDVVTEPNAPTRSGYRFDGWYMNTDYTTKYDFDTPVSENITIYAKWTKKSSGGGSSSNTTTTTTKNEDGSTTKTTTNKATGTTTEVTTNTDGSTTTVETKKDGTVTTTEKDKDGNTTTTVENPDGTSTTTEKNKDGSETVVEKDAEGTTTTTEKDSEGNKTVTTEKADGTTTTEETKKDGTTVKTETNADGETTAQVEAKGETEVVIPVPDAEDVYKVVVTDEKGNETVITDFEVVDGGVAITVDGNASVSLSKGSKKEFVDVHPVDHWSEESVDYVYIRGLMKGTSENHFSPDATLTRAMLVTVLYRLEGEPKVSGITSFADLEKGQYYLDAVCWAQLNGIVKGVSKTEFAPNDNITREQIAAIMYRYAQYKGYDVSVGENTNILSYDDVDNISEYAIGSMQYAVGSGLIKGKTESTLNPLDNATRAEAAAILERFIKAN